MTFATPMPAWAIAAVLGGLVAFTAATYLAGGGRTLAPRRIALLAGLRALSLAILFLLLLDPVRLEPLPPGGSAVAVLVDASRSMGIDDIGETRLARARALVDAQLRPALSGGFDVGVFTFGGTVSDRPLAEAAPVERRSDLRGAVDEVRARYRDRQLAAIVLLTDGADTGGTAAPAGGPPVFAVPVGAEDSGVDREVVSLSIDEEAPRGALLDLSVSIAARGAATPFMARVLENGRLVYSRRIAPERAGPVRLTVPVAPPPDADAVYAVEVDTHPDERVVANNRRSVLVRPAPARRAVLIVEGAPGFEHSFLKRSLSGDPSLDVDAVVRKGQDADGVETFYVQAAPARATALGGGLPASMEDLFRYDALVLANVDAGLLSDADLARVETFVARRGGGLLVFGARSFDSAALRGTALEPVLPVALTDRGDPALAGGARADTNRVALTADGMLHPVMRLAASGEAMRERWAALPSLASTAALGRARPGAAVLATAGGTSGLGRPLIAVQRYGEGRSMIFGGEAVWRWRMLMPAGDGTYDTFWRQSVRWLAGASPRPLDIQAPRDALAGEPARITVRVRDASFEPAPGASVTLTVDGPGGTRETIVPAADEPGLQTASFTPAQDGIYRVTGRASWPDGRVDTAATSLLIGGADVELSEPWRHDATLARLADDTGGAIVRESDLSTLPARIHAAVGDLETREAHLWHSPWIFLALLLLLSTEWTLRRRWQLR